MKKETLIVVFYILYFTWLFSVTYLTQDPNILNYFSIVVTIFYFALVRESGDFLWFLLGFAFSILLTVVVVKGFQVKFDTSGIFLIPIWLPISWGTTIVALRKFYLIVQK